LFSTAGDEYVCLGSAGDENVYLGTAGDEYVCLVLQVMNMFV